MRCAKVQDRLLLYLSGELVPREAAAVTRHLEGCAACVALAEALAETAERVDGSLATTVEPPASLDQRVMEAVRLLPPPRRPWHTVFDRGGWPQRLALAGAALCLLVAGFFGGDWYALRGSRGVVTMSAPGLDLEKLGEAHRQLLARPAAAEIAATGAGQLARELKPLVPFTLGVVDLRSEGLRLVGGNRTTVNGTGVAVLHYEWNGERVSLFEMDTHALSPVALRQAVQRSDSYFVKKTGDLTYAAWSLGRTNCVIVARSMPMHVLFRYACHASERLERS